MGDSHREPRFVMADTSCETDDGPGRLGELRDHQECQERSGTEDEPESKKRTPKYVDM